MDNAALHATEIVPTRLRSTSGLRKSMPTLFCLTALSSAACGASEASGTCRLEAQVKRVLCWFSVLLNLIHDLV
jgi:hypothetical protein